MPITASLSASTACGWRFGKGTKGRKTHKRQPRRRRRGDGGLYGKRGASAGRRRTSGTYGSSTPGSKRHIPMAYQNSPLTTPSNLYRRSGVSAAHPPSSSGSNEASSRPVGVSHTRTTPSAPPLASSAPSGENPTDNAPPAGPHNPRS